jgi:LasA protease
MQFNDNNRPLQPLFAGLSLIIISLACSIGAGNSEPFFTAPTGNAIWTSTPPNNEVEFEQPSATPDPEIVSNPDPVSTPEDRVSTLDNPPILYRAQAGDSLRVVAIRFGVQPHEIASTEDIPEKGFIPPYQLLIIPNNLSNTTSYMKLMPDSEVINSPSTIHFDINAFVNEAGGYLSTYKEYLMTSGNTSGADIVAKVALENSINPRLLLSLLEYQSGWVYGQPGNLVQLDYPMGMIDLSHKGLHKQLRWAVKHLSIGYYGWREGHITEVNLREGITARMAPDLNAGTAALQYYFSNLYDTPGWVEALDADNGMPALHEKMFGNPWIRSQTVEPLYPPGLTQPNLILPFQINTIWSFTGGPHGAWGHDGARAALDFAPGSLESGCVPSIAWVAASAPGLVVRSQNGVVIIDLDGDGFEQTGWVLMYLHIATKNRIPVNTWVDTGDFIGHPSCEGGASTGTHVHIARRYNGEWIAADGPIPFNLSGWVAYAGEAPYEGWLTKDGVTIHANVYGTFDSRIRRLVENP